MSTENNFLQSGLAQTRAQILESCRRMKLLLPVSHGTALMLHGCEIPLECRENPRIIHVTVSEARKRRMKSVLRTHVWTQLQSSDLIHMEQVWVLVPEAALASICKQWSVEQICLVIDSLIRFGSTSAEDIAEYVHQHSFHGKNKCLTALKLIQLGGDSMQEDRCQLQLNLRGVPWFTRNYWVMGLTYTSGMPMTVDLALPEYCIALEYQGDQHRTQQDQYRRDLYKNNTIRNAGWTVFEVTADDLKSSQRLDALATNILHTIANRGGPMLSLVHLSWQQLADKRRKMWQKPMP